VEIHSKLKFDEIDWIFTCSGVFCCLKTKETRAKAEGGVYSSIQSGSSHGLHPSTYSFYFLFDKEIN
jgi:hypothetical protein